MPLYIFIHVNARIEPLGKYQSCMVPKTLLSACCPSVCLQRVAEQMKELKGQGQSNNFDSRTYGRTRDGGVLEVVTLEGVNQKVEGLDSKLNEVRIFHRDPYTGACGYNRPCAQKYVCKYQSCMVISERLYPHAPVSI